MVLARPILLILYSSDSFRAGCFLQLQETHLYSFISISPLSASNALAAKAPISSCPG